MIYIYDIYRFLPTSKIENGKIGDSEFPCLKCKKDSSHYTSIRQNSQKRKIEVVRGNISAFPASTIRPLSYYPLWRGSSRIQQLW